MMKTLGLFLSLVLIFPTAAAAEHSVSHVTVGSGGGSAASAAHRLGISIGQPLTGSSRSDQHAFGAGVWMPVPVLLLSFSAVTDGGGVVLVWEIAGETADQAGFQVYRENAAGGRDRLTGELLHGATRYEFTDPDPPPGRATYWLAEVGRTGTVVWHGPVTVDLESAATFPMLLLQNKPNPFRRATTITFQIPEGGPVTLAVFDVTGREVVRLTDAAYPSGRHEITWPGRDARGQRVSSGVYFYRLSTRSGIQTRKLVVSP